MALQADNNMLKSPKNRCRICLEATNGKIELDQTIQYKETGILLTELLEFCVNEQVYVNGKADGLCLDCLEKGMVCYEFKRRFKESQAVLLKELEENYGFSYAIKAEADFQEESFEVEAENIVIKDEILEEEELQQVKENPIKFELPTTTTETEKSTTRSDKLTTTLSGDKPILTPLDDQPTISLGQKEGVQHKRELCEKNLKLRSSLVRQKHTQKPRNPCSYVQESSTAFVQDIRNDIQQQNLKNTDPLLQSAETNKPTTKNDKHTCEYCGKILTRAGNLMIHMKIHTGEKPFSCKECGMNFRLAATLVSHRRTHTGEKPFSCKVCGRSFAQSTNLKTHQLVHTKQKDNVCEKCGTTFATVESLRRHEEIHSTERPSYKCTICKKAFGTNWEKKRHMLTHTRGRNYACEFCGRRFKRSSGLNVHRKTHTGETPHICNVCGKSYLQSQNLKKHMNTHLTK